MIMGSSITVIVSPIRVNVSCKGIPLHQPRVGRTMLTPSVYTVSSEKSPKITMTLDVETGSIAGI